ncbi:MAG: FRG domain-containing protein [Gemmatimonadetes bacterium]|nr:FRG domain-containing protein [Gemmatimonadota bacterium]
MNEKELRRIRTLSGFMKWAEQFNDGQYLFRGVTRDTYEIEASTYRRLKEEEDKVPTNLLKINKELIEAARRMGHDQKDGQRLSDLDLLAELQHFGAATCLIDFTRDVLVALWFACQQSSGGPANGKIVAVRIDDPARFRTVGTKLIEEDIDHFFEPDANGQYLLYQWQPKHQNNRIIAQKSVFVFGGIEIETEAECVIIKSSKQEILGFLDKLSGITEASMFPDFDGFARLHAQNKPYTESDLQDYLQRSIEADQNNNRDDAIALYTEFINNMAAITETLSQGPRGEENDELDEN